ncbi:MAG: hypothetical protein Q4F72_12770, partial [Desulfovibrionaceae bacterium]|nr:hypothetical protein [Desulfovibrionaceae bacterium]
VSAGQAVPAAQAEERAGALSGQASSAAAAVSAGQAVPAAQAEERAGALSGQASSAAAAVSAGQAVPAAQAEERAGAAAATAGKAGSGAVSAAASAGQAVPAAQAAEKTGSGAVAAAASAAVSAGQAGAGAEKEAAAPKKRLTRHQQREAEWQRLYEADPEKAMAQRAAAKEARARQLAIRRKKRAKQRAAEGVKQRARDLTVEQEYRRAMEDWAWEQRDRRRAAREEARRLAQKAGKGVEEAAAPEAPGAAAAPEAADGGEAASASTRPRPYIRWENSPGWREKTRRLAAFFERLNRGFYLLKYNVRLPFTRRHYNIDVLLYNRRLRCRVLVILVAGSLTQTMRRDFKRALAYCTTEWPLAAGESAHVGMICHMTGDTAELHFVTHRWPRTLARRRYKGIMPTSEELRREYGLDRAPDPEEDGRD